MSTSTRTPTTRVSALRTLSIALAFAAVLGLVFGTAGFTAMQADRGLAVNVTSDERASLGYEPLTDTVQSGEPTPVVEYRNRFNGDIAEFDVDVSLSEPEETRTAIASTETPDGLPNGQRERVSVALSCPVEEAVDLRFEASGSGAGVSVSLDRVHTVTCVPEDDGSGGDEAIVTGVGYNDAANADVDTEGPDGNVTATVWIVDSPPVDTADAIEPVAFEGDERLDTSKKVRPAVVQHRAPGDLPSDWKIVAVEFPDQGVAYVHPEWNAGEYTTPKTGGGVAFTEVPLDADRLLRAGVEDGSVVVGDRAGESSE